jgi:hypothetical protein
MWFRNIKETYPEIVITKMVGGRYRLALPDYDVPFEYCNGLIYMEPNLQREMWFDSNRDEYFKHLVMCNTLNKLK